MLATAPSAIATLAEVDDRAAVLDRLRSTRGRRTVAIVPAHNEGAVIAATVESLLQQSEPPTVVLVAANNCSDDTEWRARDAGALVMLAEPNRHRKAGAINLALDLVDAGLTDEDAVLIMDGDTTLAPQFIEVGLGLLRGRVGGVGGVFVGRPASSLLGEFQRMEFHRYAREVRRNGNRAFVLTGTGTLFSVGALRSVRGHRDGDTLPAGVSFYDTASLTEDNEMTLAVTTCGYDAVSDPRMGAVTDVMESLPSLWHQRTRWYLGALHNIRDYGRRMPRHLRWVYWRQQVGLLLASLVLAVNGYIILTGTVSGGLHVAPIWLGVMGAVALERTLTVWTMGWKQRLIALSLIEQFYAALLTVIFACAAWEFLRGRRGSWHPT